MSRRIYIMTKQMLVQTLQDTILFVCIFAPFLCRGAITFLVPMLEDRLTEYFGMASVLEPYYLIFELLVAVSTGMVFHFVAAMVILGEFDVGITKYIGVTPVGVTGYLLARFALPASFSILLNLILLKIGSLVSLSFVNRLGISILCTLLGIIVAQLVTALSSNKVEGMAIVKLSGILMMFMGIPFFTEHPLSLLAGITPGYWIGKYAFNKTLMEAAMGVLISVVWIILLSKKFNKKFK